MPRIMGFSQVELTVSDCDRTAIWWREVLTVVFRDPDNIPLEFFVHPDSFDPRV